MVKGFEGYTPTEIVAHVSLDLTHLKEIILFRSPYASILVSLWKDITHIRVKVRFI